MSDTTTVAIAGWHYAEGDPEGTVRYWDGTNWNGEPIPVAQAAEKPRRSSRVSASTALKFVGRPEIIETPSGITIKVGVANRGPIDALVSFDVKLKGGGSIKLTNPTALIEANHGPATVQLSVPLDSGIATNTKLSVTMADQAGRTMAISGTTGGTISLGVGTTVLAGLLGIGGLIVIPPLLDDGDTEDVATTTVFEEPPAEEEEESEGSTTTETPVVEERSPASELQGTYPLAMIESNAEQLDPSNFAMALDLVLVSDEDCTDCTYDVVHIYDGEQTVGQVTLADDDARTELETTFTAGPLDLHCEVPESGAIVSDYLPLAETSVTVAAQIVDGRARLEAKIAGDFDLESGEPSVNCPQLLEVEAIYSTDGTTGFTVGPPPEVVVPPEELDGFSSFGPTTVTCDGAGQSCSHELTFDVIDGEDGPDKNIVLTAGEAHCSPIAYAVVVDGDELGFTEFLGAGESSTIPIVALGADFGSDPTAVSIRATGTEAGCNTGDILGWAVTVDLVGLLAVDADPSVVPVS